MSEPVKDDSPLPDPLLRPDGARITNADAWRTRRSEIIEYLEREMYGQSPLRPTQLAFELRDTEPQALGGLATRQQVIARCGNEADAPAMEILLYIPNGAVGPVPAIAGLSFSGNWTAHADPGIYLPDAVADAMTPGVRGAASSRWPIETILSRGYAIAIANYNDLAKDSAPEYLNGVGRLNLERHERGDNLTAIGIWAWSLSRILDYLETVPAVDARRVAAFGHSRLGKAALWAAAKDERFALALINESGAGGAKLFHRGVGEGIRRLNTVFPHWFCQNFRKYNDADRSLPWDQHFVISLLAPRPVYIGSAADDTNADPEGEFRGAKSAEPVYQLLGVEGLPTDHWPPVDTSVQGQIGYHVRSGKHDVTAFDWQNYLDFADRHLIQR